VRRATVGELARVMEVARGTATASHWTRAAYEKYQSEYREDLFHRCLLVAADGDEVTGFVAGSYLEGDDTALLENLAVDAAWRRRGVASALCAAMMAWAKSEGAWGLQLEVRVSNDAAQALYAELGFVEEGRRKKYYSDPEEDGVSMGLQFR
jgi:ribosomal-protein-alanine N-acetyltransferase